MAFATLGGIPVIEARVSLPRVGAWTAQLRVDTTERPVGQTRLQIGNVAFLGAVAASIVHEAASHVRLVGGAGGLAQDLPAKGYIASPVSVPLRDIARETGETLAPNSDSNVLNFQLQSWSRVAGAAGNALAVLLEQVDRSVWRFLPSGELWVGLETWPKTNVAVELTGYEPVYDRIRFFSLTPGVLPGMTFLGRRASYVEHHISEARVSTQVWFEEDAVSG